MALNDHETASDPGRADWSDSVYIRESSKLDSIKHYFWIQLDLGIQLPLHLTTDVEDPKSALPTVAVVLIHDLPRLYLSHVTHAILPIN